MLISTSLIYLLEKIIMKKVLIFGAGSIGNHMSKACTDLGYDVYITDISQKALKRMRNFLYPLRYKKWNNKIKLINIVKYLI